MARDAGRSSDMRLTDIAIEDFELFQAPGHLIRRAQQRAVEFYAEEVGENGLRPRQFALLLSIGRNPGANQTDLVRITGIDRSTMTDLARRLADRGLLERRPTAGDKRSKALWITAAGRRAVAGTYAGMLRTQERILAPLSPEMREIFMRCLKSMSDAANHSGSSRATAKSDGR